MKLIDRFVTAVPFVCLLAGLLLMLLLEDSTGIFGGLILITAGCVELGRRRLLHHTYGRTHRSAAALLARSVAKPKTDALRQMRWREAYDSGHPVIDTQHKKLFEIGDRLIHAVQRTHTRAKVEAILDELVEHIEEHFKTEEAVLAGSGHPITKEHLDSHVEMLEHAKSLRDRYRSRHVHMQELVSFIANDVVAEHIIKEDLKFSLQSGGALTPSAA
jgi:hemerythrin-like metal-binding protein